MKTCHFCTLYDNSCLSVEVYKRELVSINRKHDIIIKLHDARVYSTHFSFEFLLFESCSLIRIDYHTLNATFVSFFSISFWEKSIKNLFAVYLTGYPIKSSSMRKCRKDIVIAVFYSFFPLSKNNMCSILKITILVWELIKNLKCLFLDLLIFFFKEIRTCWSIDFSFSFLCNKYKFSLYQKREGSIYLYSL